MIHAQSPSAITGGRAFGYTHAAIQKIYIKISKEIPLEWNIEVDRIIINEVRKLR